MMTCPSLKSMAMVVAAVAGLLRFELTSSIADETPTPVPYRITEDIVYGNKDGLALTLDALVPDTGAKGLGVILVSSGSWKSSKSDIPGQDEARRAREHWVQGLLQGGYTVLLARHGSAPRYFVPEMVEDIRRSVRFVRMNAQRFAVDGDRLGITSGSSGGHLSLMVALTGDDGIADSKDPVERISSRVQAVVAWFPPTDLVNWGGEDGYRTIQQFKPELLAGLFPKITDLPAQLKTISPIYFVSSEDPPLLLIHGDRDLTVPLQQSQVLQEKYAEAGRPVELVVHQGGGHSWWPGIMADYQAVTAWFDRYLRPSDK
jgi:acetyl esterase/lipase